jgi:hypothetical protein
MISMMSTQLRVAVVQFAPKVSARFLGDENSSYNRTSSTSSAKCRPTSPRLENYAEGMQLHSSTFEDDLTTIL